MGTPSTFDSLRSVLAEIHGSLDLTQTLDAIAHGVATGTCFKVAAVTVVLPNGDYQVVAVEGDDSARVQLLDTTEPSSTWERLFDLAKPLGGLLWVDDRHHVLDESMTAWTPEGPTSDDPDAWRPEDVLFAPLIDSGGGIVGALSVDVPVDGLRPTLDQAAEIELYAAQAALAIEHAHRFAAAQQNAVLRERERMAEDMHDFVAQGLWGACLHLERARSSSDLEQVRQLMTSAIEAIEDASQQLRSSIRAITPTKASDAYAEVKRIVDSAGLNSEPAPTLRWIGDHSGIPPAVASDVFAVTTEALANAAKHARATEISVAITVSDTAITVCIRDDGVGLGQSAGRGNSGLDTMRRRAVRHHGSCRYLDTVPHGVTIIWSVPQP